MEEKIAGLLGIVGMVCLTSIILISIKSCENTYVKAFENGYTSCSIQGSSQVYWCKDGKVMEEK
jgi:hypothetical protein